MHVRDCCKETKRNPSDTLINMGTLTKIQTFKLFPVFKNNTEKSLSDISSNITKIEKE